MLVQIIHSQGPQCFLSIHHLCNTGLILTVQKQFAFETAVHHSTNVAAQRQLHSTCRNIRNRSSTQLLPHRKQTVLTRRLVPARQCAAALLPTLTCHWSTAISGLHRAVFLIGRAVGLKAVKAHLAFARSSSGQLGIRFTFTCLMIMNPGQHKGKR